MGESAFKHSAEFDLVEVYVERTAQMIAQWLREQPAASHEEGLGRFQIAEDVIWSAEIYHRVQAALDKLCPRGACRDSPVASAPSCNGCGQTTALAYVIPKLGPHPEMRSFKCPGCGEVEAHVIQGTQVVVAYRGPERRRTSGT